MPRFLHPIALAVAVLAVSWAACRPAPATKQSSPTMDPRSSGATQTRNFGSPSWGNAATLCLDPAASTSCSGGGSITDNNDCSCACTAPGIGPCLHWYELLNRWYGYSPMFINLTEVKLLSSQTAAQSVADPMTVSPYFYGYADASSGFTGMLYVLGVPTTVTTTTISAVTAPNRSTGTRFHVTLAAGGGKGTFYVNTTRGSTAWSLSGAAAGSNIMSAPQNCNSLGDPTVSYLTCSNGNGATTTNWAVSDTVLVKTLPTWGSGSLLPNVQYMGFTEGAGIYVRQVSFWHFQGEDVGDTPMNIGDHVSIQDCNFEHNPAMVGTAIQNGGVTQYGIAGSYIQGNIQGGQAMGQFASNTYPLRAFSILGGGILGTLLAGSEVPAVHNVLFDNDVVLESGSLTISGNSFVGSFENEGTVYVNSGNLDASEAGNAGISVGAPIMWGGGTLDSGHGTVFYNTGATGGASTFPSSLTLNVAGGSSACLTNLGAVLTTLTCNLTIASGANLDTNLGTKVGCLGASHLGFCNTPF